MNLSDLHLLLFMILCLHLTSPSLTPKYIHHINVSVRDAQGVNRWCPNLIMHLSHLGSKPRDSSSGGLDGDGAVHF